MGVTQYSKADAPESLHLESPGCRRRRNKNAINRNSSRRDSVHASAHSSAQAATAPTAARPRGQSGCKGWGGHRGRHRRRHGAAAGAGSASPAVPVRKGRSNASFSPATLQRPCSGRIRGGPRAAPHRPVRSSRSSVLNTSCQNKGAGEGG